MVAAACALVGKGVAAGCAISAILDGKADPSCSVAALRTASTTCNIYFHEQITQTTNQYLHSRLTHCYDKRNCLCMKQRINMGIVVRRIFMIFFACKPAQLVGCVLPERPIPSYRALSAPQSAAPWQPAIDARLIFDHCPGILADLHQSLATELRWYYVIFCQIRKNCFVIMHVSRSVFYLFQISHIHSRKLARSDFQSRRLAPHTQRYIHMHFRLGCSVELYGITVQPSRPSHAGVTTGGT